MHPEQFDLNLVRIFCAILHHRNITSAGLQLGLTQSSVSHALRRLRALCADPLFVRTGEGMEPTAMALRLAAPFASALASIHAGLEDRESFDPMTSTRTFRLLLSDVGQLIYLPRLAEHFSRHAPGLKVEALHLPQDAYRHALASGAADLAIGHLPTLQGGFHRVTLFEDPYVCFLRADHPEIRASMSARQYFAATHVTVDQPGRGPGLVERTLARSRRERTIVMRIPHFFAALLILRRTNHILSAPSRLTEAFEDASELRVLPLPFRVERLSVGIFWHERVHHDSGLRWLRQLLSALFSERQPAPQRRGRPVG